MGQAEKEKRRNQEMNLTIRLENPADYRIVEELVRRAFWNNTDRGVTVDEHLLVHKLRKSPIFVPELDYVAEMDGKIIGSVMYSKSKIVTKKKQEYEVLTFGPLCVLPEYQNQGVGKALMKFTITEAARLGYTAIVFCGNPDYYSRLGFLRGAEFDLTYTDGRTFDAFMAMELVPGALDKKGRFFEDPIFRSITEDEVKRFDQDFSPLAPRPVVSIDVLLECLEPAAREGVKSMNLSCLGELYGLSQREIASLPGIDDKAIRTICTVMGEHGRIWGAGGKINANRQL